MIVEGSRHSLKFSVKANQPATATALKEAAQRVPDILDVDKEIMKSLPDPGKSGALQDVEDDQVAGTRCAASKKLINLEEDARLCDGCGQVFHKEGVPESCPSCEKNLKSHTLSA
jgi:rubrerythrin